MKTREIVGITLIILIASVGKGNAATVDDLTPRTFADGNGHTLPYRLFVPTTIPSQKVPLILFFHGAYERGTDNRGQVSVNAPLQLIDATSQTQNPCFFAAPQCPPDQQWVAMPWGDASGMQPASPSWPLAAAMQMLDSLIKEYPSIDQTRLYIVGLSMGGYATWDAICRWPDRFAAAIPICGGGDSSKVAPIVSLPIWAFHSADDGIVPVTRTRQMITAIKNRGGTPKYTEFCTNGLPCYGHYSWGPSYDEPGVWPWLFSKTNAHRLKLSDTLVTINIEMGKPHSIQTRAISVVNVYPAEHLSGPVTIMHKSSWLSVSINAANPDSQVLTNTIDASLLPDIEQKYYDTVIVHAGNGSIQDQSYRIFMWIREEPILKDFSIIPGDSGSLSSSTPFRFSAVAKDQYGTPLSPQPAITWSATGGSIDENGVFTPAGVSAVARIIASTQGNASFKDTVTAFIIPSSKGLACDIYNHQYITTVNTIASLTPSKSMIADSISLQPASTTADSFALRYSGYLFVPASGSYTFYLTSDDGSALFIDGNKIIDNDGPHGAGLKSKAVTLGWGLHAISVLFFEQGWGQVLILNWQVPGLTGSAGPIPDSLLFNRPNGATEMSKNIDDIHPGLVSGGSADIRVKSNGLIVDAPEGLKWELELFTLNGSKIIQHSGTGTAIVPFVKHQFSSSNFLISRIRTVAGVAVKIVAPKSSPIMAQR
jgi:pimeloyl-ACP methyl ester carboxylesterase